MTKINITNSIIFVTDSIAMSHIDDMEDDVAADMVMMWIAMMTCKLTWPMTWLLTWRVTSAPRPICEWAQFSLVHRLGPNISQPTINFQLTKISTIYSPNKNSAHQFIPFFPPIYRNKNPSTKIIASHESRFHSASIQHRIKSTDHIHFFSSSITCHPL